MGRYALLLRGVNVGQKNSLPMAELRAMLERLGCTEVETYVQSGNAVLETKRTAAGLTRAIEAELAAYMGRPIAVTTRTAAELEALGAAHPFEALAAQPAHLCVTFLAAAPSAAELAPLAAKDFTPERFQVAGREIYTWHPNGQSGGELALALAKLPVQGTLTTRNWNTVQKLRAMIRRR